MLVFGNKAVTYVKPSTLYFNGRVSPHSCEQLLLKLNEIQSEHLQQRTRALRRRLKPNTDCASRANMVHSSSDDAEPIRTHKARARAKRDEEEEETDLTHVDIELYIMSGGGSLRPMLGIIDYIVEMQNTPLKIMARGNELEKVDMDDERRIVQPRQIQARVTGYALSAAFLLTLAANKRMMGPNSSMLMHEISSMAVGNQSDQANHISNINYATSQVLSFIAKRTGLLEYAYHGTIAQTHPAIVYTTPDAGNATGNGYRATAYVLLSDCSCGVKLTEMKLRQIPPDPLHSDAHPVHFDVSKPVLVLRDGSYVSQKTLSERAMEHDMPDMADMRHAVRVCYPLWRAWVDVTQRRIQDSATVRISDEQRRNTVQLTDSVHYVMMRLSEGDRMLSANECHRMGVVNLGTMHPQQRLPQNPLDDIRLPSNPSENNGMF